MKFKYTIICSIFLFLPIQFVLADIFELDQNKKIFGQLVAVNSRTIFIETIDSKQKIVITITLPVSKVLRVTDENGTNLFSEGKLRIPKPELYHRPINSNWEELKDHFKIPRIDSLYFINGEPVQGRIIDITEAHLFLELLSSESGAIKQVKKYQLSSISRIGNKVVIQINQSIPVRKVVSAEIEYPVYNFSLGLAYVSSDFSKIRNLFNDYYQSEGITQQAAERFNNYLGLQAYMDMYLSSSIAVGFGAYYFKRENINWLSLITSDVKYTFADTYLRPSLSVGFAGMDFRSSEKVADKRYYWQASKASITFGFGINSGKILDDGFSARLFYMPFGKSQTYLENTNSAVSRKLDFSLIMLKASWCFSFN